MTFTSLPVTMLVGSLFLSPTKTMPLKLTYKGVPITNPQANLLIDILSEECGLEKDVNLDIYKALRKDLGRRTVKAEDLVVESCKTSNNSKSYRLIMLAKKFSKHHLRAIRGRRKSVFV